MIRRNLEDPLRRLMGYYPVVAVTGPRQSGKSTLCRSAYPDYAYVSLEPLDQREFARKDPRGFLAEWPGQVIVDEIQHVPELLSYIQDSVDEDATPGRFLLTGSQHFGLHAAISQSMAGRVGMLHLLPPSYDELLRFPKPPKSLLETLWMGAYPRIHDRGIPPDVWLRDYVLTFVQRDVRQVLHVRDLSAFSTFLHLLAGRTATELNLSSLGSDAGIRHNTAREWLSVLEAGFIVRKIPAWHRNVRKQQIKAPKIHLLDSGLACHLLGIRSADDLRHHPLRGAIFESWVASEIMKFAAHAGIEDRLYHYRDAKGLEVDLVLDTGRVPVLTEVKSGATWSSDFARNLNALDREMDNDPVLRVVYGGAQTGIRNGVEAVAWSDMSTASWQR